MLTTSLLAIALAPAAANAAPAPGFDALKTFGEAAARAITLRKFADLYAMACVEPQPIAKAPFVKEMSELHKANNTKSASVGTDDEIVRENRKAGATSPEDFGKLTTAMLPIRIVSVDKIAGRKVESSAVQVWRMRIENGRWCAGMDDFR